MAQPHPTVILLKVSPKSVLRLMDINTLSCVEHTIPSKLVANDLKFFPHYPRQHRQNEAFLSSTHFLRRQCSRRSACSCSHTTRDKGCSRWTSRLLLNTINIRSRNMLRRRSDDVHNGSSSRDERSPVSKGVLQLPRTRSRRRH